MILIKMRANENVGYLNFIIDSFFQFFNAIFHYSEVRFTRFSCIPGKREDCGIQIQLYGDLFKKTNCQFSCNLQKAFQNAN